MLGIILASTPDGIYPPVPIFSSLILEQFLASETLLSTRSTMTCPNQVAQRLFCFVPKWEKISSDISFLIFLIFLYSRNIY